MQEEQIADSKIEEINSDEFKEKIEDTLSSKLTLFVLFIGFFAIFWRKFNSY